MAKQPKPVPRWRISLLKGTPAKFLGPHLCARREGRDRGGGEGIKIADALRDPIVARREP
jgi:hypothetical protein